MIVDGLTVREAAIDAAIERMRNGEQPWKARDIESAVWSIQRKPDPVRVADRLIQRERKAGRIRMVDTAKWAWQGAVKQCL